MILCLVGIRKVKPLNNFLIVDLILRIDRENSYNFNQFTQSERHSNFAQNILKLSLVNIASAFVIVKAESIE